VDFSSKSIDQFVQDAIYAHGFRLSSVAVKVLRERASNIIKVVGLRASKYVGRFTRIHSQSWRCGPAETAEFVRPQKTRDIGGADLKVNPAKAGDTKPPVYGI